MFNDQLLDHAEYGTKVLFDDSKIRLFCESDQYDELIRKTISNHSLFQINNEMTSREQLFCNILRDADKLDIFRVKLSGNLNIMYDDPLAINEQKISVVVVNELLNHHSIQRVLCKSILDQWLVSVGFVFDLNFRYSLQVVKENEHVYKILHYFIYNSLCTRQDIHKIEMIANNYLSDKL